MSSQTECSRCLDSCACCMLHAACEFHMQFALVGAVIGFIQREERLLDIGTSSALAEIGVTFGY